MSVEMYQQNIIDHNRHPRNFGELPNADAKAHAANPLCGDELDFFLKFDDQAKLSEVKFSGRGCAITMASASMLSEKLKGMAKADVENLSNNDIVKLLGVTVNPARMRCATLSLETVQQAVGHH